MGWLLGKLTGMAVGSCGEYGVVVWAFVGVTGGDEAGDSSKWSAEGSCCLGEK